MFVIIAGKTSITTTATTTIKQQQQQVRRTTCLACRAAGRSGRSDRCEEYYDLQLQIQGCHDVEDCLELYFVPEDLDGDNKCVVV